MTKPPKQRNKSTAAGNTKPPPSVTAEEYPADATITVSSVEVPELTEQEQSDRLHLERKVERAVFEALKALMELRDRRLYRSTHSTFEDYCKDRFGFERRHPYRLMEACAVFDNLILMCPNGTQTESNDEQMCPNGTQTVSELNDSEMCQGGTQILPTSERQVRPLVTLEAEVQRDAWQTAVKKAGGKVPSARIVSDVVQRIMERTKVPNTYCVGEVCQILARDNPELRGEWRVLGNCKSGERL